MALVSRLWGNNNEGIEREVSEMHEWASKDGYRPRRCAAFRVDSSDFFQCDVLCERQEVLLGDEPPEREKRQIEPETTLTSIRASLRPARHLSVI